MFNDMGIQVYDEAPGCRDAAHVRDAPPPVADEDVEEEAEAALSTVDSEFGRTTDPVRMYMREMGSVELLTREGEIEIAKRIEDGLKHMIQAISRLPDHDRRDPRPRRDGRERTRCASTSWSTAWSTRTPRTSRRRRWRRAEDEELEDDDAEEDEDEDDGAAASAASLLQLKEDALERFGKIRRLLRAR